MAKKQSIKSLLKKVDDLISRVDSLEKKVGDLEKEKTSLLSENNQLREKLQKYENPKNSSNSSIPPSKDENRPLRTKSLREQTGRKSGGQPGHEGNTLKMTGTPDKIINHLPNTCDCCGNELSRFQSICVGKRQVVDIPPVKPEYTEHRIYQTTCSCGKTTESKYPQQVKTPISYGSNVESLIGYFHSRQYLPTDRMRELFHDLFGLPVSEGGIPYILNRLSKKALPSYESIRGKIATSQVIGTDETGVKINGKNHWYWTWQNQELTFIVPSDNRGFKTIEDNFDHKFHQAILVHDCWKSHFQIGRRHQLCLVHLLRELNYFTESHKLAWPRQFKKMLKKAIEIKKQMKPENYNDHYQPRSEIEKILERLLNKQVNPNFKELVSFKKRMTKYRDYLFTFLHHLHVPPENNASERAIRNIKVKQKISGQFKSMKGAIQFAILRSITDTAIKNDQKVLNTLFEIADLKATE